MKQTITLNERQLNKIIKESMNKILNEHTDSWNDEQNVFLMEKLIELKKTLQDMAANNPDKSHIYNEINDYIFYAIHRLQFNV